MADQKTPEDDKSINDLLKEYASDVKDKDLDDFLKDSNDDAFESAVAEDEDDDDAEGEEAIEGAEPRKSSSGVLSLLLIVVAFAAAGAGAWVYLNRDDGMTAIMGGFMGGQDEGNAPVALMPPPPLADNTAMPADAMTSPAPMPDAPAQPMPIMNENAPTLESPADSAAMPAPVEPVAAPAMPEPAAPVATAAPAALTETAPDAAAPAAKLPPAGETVSAQDAVSDWSGDTNAATMLPANTDPVAKLPEKAVEPVKAKPVSAPKQAKKTEPLMQNKDTASKAPVDTSMDGALLPPYLAIQAKKGSGYTAPVAPAPVPAASTASADVASGVSAAMVANGGGAVTAPATQPVPSAMMKAVPPPFTPTQMPEAAPAAPLAINGGRSMPDGGPSQAPAQIQAPNTPSMPEAAPAPAQAAPVAAAPAPAAASVGNSPAAALVAQGDAARASGDNAKALSLYEQALETDAVYGDGKSIDRGAVYDRIGAVRSAR